MRDGTGMLLMVVVSKCLTLGLLIGFCACHHMRQHAPAVEEQASSITSSELPANELAAQESVSAITTEVWLGRIAPDGDKLRFITRSVDGALPQRILFSGASNQATLEVGP